MPIEDDIREILAVYSEMQPCLHSKIYAKLLKTYSGDDINEALDDMERRGIIAKRGPGLANVYWLR